jgi:hypothetical protein
MCCGDAGSGRVRAESYPYTVTRQRHRPAMADNKRKILSAVAAELCHTETDVSRRILVNVDRLCYKSEGRGFETR